MDEKKRKINGIVVPSCLAVFLIMSFIGYGELKGKVKTNSKAIEKVEETPLKIAVMKNDIEYLKTGQTEMKQALKAILRAINGE